MNLIGLKNLQKAGSILAIAGLMMTGCKKETNNPGPQIPGSTKKDFAINFSARSISIAEVETGTITLRDANQNVVTKKTFQKGAKALYTDFTNIAAGRYTVEMTVNTQKQADGTARQYADKTTITLPVSTTTNINAPVGNYADTWYKRAVFFADNNNVTATVAMDPRDSYCSIKLSEAKWSVAGIQRSAVNVNYQVAIQEHERMLSGVIGFEDFTAFNQYTQKMQGKDWTSSTISMYLIDNSGHEVYIDYEFDKQ